MGGTGQDATAVVDTPGRSRAVLWATVALLAHLALFDLALETFGGGSIHRWWLVPGLVGVAAINAWLFRPGGRLLRRFGPGGAATAPVAAWLAALVFAAWVAGSGVRLLAHDASFALCLVSAVAVVLGLVSIVRARLLPPVALLSLAACGAYAVAAFLLAAHDGTSYQAVLRGTSFWSRLPFLLQGAFLGGFLVLPLAVACEAIGAVRRLRNPWRLREVVALSLVVVMAASGWRPGSPQPTSQAQATSQARAASQEQAALEGAPYSRDASLAVPRDLDATRFVPRLPAAATHEPQLLTTGAGALAARIPAARFDLIAYAATLGPGIEPAFSFVRDAIRYEPYPGILRGSWGTFLSRAGNAADRSLLLGTLLALKGVKTRYASGTLDRATAERLYQHAFDAPLAPAGDLPRRGAAAGVPDLQTRIFERARRDYTVVRSALAKRLQPVSRPSREDVLAEIQPHLWVQAEVAGRWIDLDPSLAGSAPGAALCPVQRTSDTPPDALCQRVKISVSVERLSDGGLDREKVLSATYNALELLDRDVFLFHTKASGGGGLLSRDGGADQWIPVLRVGGGEEVGRPVSFGATAPDMGAILGGGEAGSEFVAEWLEIDIQAPGGSREVTERTLVDRAGRAWRDNRGHPAEALRPLARDDHGVRAAQSVHNIWFSAGRHNLAQYATGLASLARDSRPSPAAGEQMPIDVQLGLAAFQNFAWVLVTDHLLVPALNDDPAFRFFADSPRVTILTTGPDPWEPGERLLLQADLRRDHLRGIARENDGMGLAERKLWFGMLEGAFEHEMMADQAAAAGADPATVRTTSSLLAKGGVQVLAAPSAPPAGASPETAARMAAALRGRATLAVPDPTTQGDAMGWWQVEAGSGDARAVLGPDLNWSSVAVLNYVSAAAPRTFTLVDPWTCMSMDFPIGTDEKVAERTLKRAVSRQLAAKREAALRKQGGGNEYIAVVKDVALFTAFSVACLVVGALLIVIYKVLDYLVDRALWG